MRAIVVATAEGREAWLRDCLKSLEGYTRYPVIILDQFSYELGKIQKAYELGLTEFLFIQDSCVVKDYQWIDDAFNHEGDVGIGQWPYFMYLGKYTKQTLDKTPIPQALDKHDSVRYEREWTRGYVRNAHNLRHILPDLKDCTEFTEKHGRLNMILETHELIKYKGTWDVGMIEVNQ